MHRFLPPMLALTLLVGGSELTQAQPVAQKRVLCPGVASISVPKSAFLGSSQGSYYFSLIQNAGESIMAAGNVY
jgi:hypothetical protein